MIDIIKSFSEFIVSRSNSWGFKTAFLISLFGVLISFDYILKISYNHHLNNKLDQLEKVNKIKDYYRSNLPKQKLIEKLENEIIENTHYTAITNNKYLEFKNKSNGVDEMAFDTLGCDTLFIDTKIKHQTQSTITVNTRNYTWMFISSNPLIVLAFPILLFMPFYDKKARSGSGIIGWFASLVFLWFFASLTTWITYKIPLILNNANINYALNLLINVILIIIISKASDKANKNV
jgi:hypothetical protein